jgi:hypothetical protein
MEHQAALLLGALVSTNRMLALVTASQYGLGISRIVLLPLDVRLSRRPEASGAPCAEPQLARPMMDERRPHLPTRHDGSIWKNARKTALQLTGMIHLPSASMPWT